MSSRLRPASSAGESEAMCVIPTPLSVGRPKLAAKPGVMSMTLAPKSARRTSPCSISVCKMGFTRSIEMAKPMFWAPWMMAVLIPTTRPKLSTGRLLGPGRGR